MKPLYALRMILFILIYVGNLTHHLAAQCNSFIHDNSALNSWLSCETSANPKTTGTDNHWILYDLGDVYELSSIHLWNYNESGKTNQGIDNYSIDLSLDAFQWITAGYYQLLEASGTNGYSGESGPNLFNQKARYILLTVIDNHGGLCSGLSEIKILVADPQGCIDFNLNAMVYPQTCENSPNGKIQVSIEGGAEPFILAWNDGASGETREMLSAGQYSVTVTDNNYCQEALNIQLPFATEDPLVYNMIPIPSKAYFDPNDIVSQGIIPYNGNVGLYSSSAIELSQGFEVVEGGNFVADIENCSTGTQHEGLYFGLIESASSHQKYSDYLGAGHMSGISVSASHEAEGTKAIYTLGGYGLMPDQLASSRFLAQATFGADEEMIIQLEQMGIEDWLNWQISVERQDFNESFDSVIARVWEDQGKGLTEFQYFRMAWWQNTMTGEDYLRDRIAFALSEIFVVSNFSDLVNFGEGLTDYYDILHKNALENFRDILFDVTMHPSMGVYLSHINNPKSDPANNQFPDENYAREVMQLFTIGLKELNVDGTSQKDVYGKEIDTYSNDEILEFSKVFTGLGFDAVGAKFGSRRFYDFTAPMIMYEDFHETGEKQLLKGFTVPSGQTGMEDINDAVDNLFNHPNVAPFISRRLIQRLVKSNPTPEYLARVSAIFNDNGDGIRGDLSAVVRAILLDPEARDCSWLSDPSAGMLREPIVRYTQFLRTFNASSPDSTFYTTGNLFQTLTFQAPLGATSVFNFFQPDYIPPGPAGEENFYGPEFQILNSYTAVGFYNIFNFLKENNNVLATQNGDVQVDFSDELAIALDTDALISRLDLLLTHGTLSDFTTNTMKDALNALPPIAELKLRMAIYLFFTCPEFSILK